MTQTEWHEAWDLIAASWPRVAPRLSDEEQASYARVLRGYRLDEVRAAIRGHLDNEGKFPMAYQLRKRIPQVTADSGKKQDGGAATFHDQVRRRWAKERPEHRDRYLDMSDHEVDVAYAHAEWEGCEAVYGAGDSSFTAWWKWQRLIGNTDELPQMREDYQRVTDALDYEQLRERFNTGRMVEA